MANSNVDRTRLIAYFYGEHDEPVGQNSVDCTNEAMRLWRTAYPDASSLAIFRPGWPWPVASWERTAERTRKVQLHPLHRSAHYV